MSLVTDKVFYRALQASLGIVASTGGRIYNTSIPVPDEQLDNEPLPFIIVSFDGMNNDGYTKDNSYEGDTDHVTISIEVAANTREELAVLMEDIRKQICTYFDTYTPSEGTEDLSDLIPDDYTLSASAIQYDSVKPCFYQTLTYACDTLP